MELSEHTTSLLEELERIARKPLRMRAEVALLLELVHQHHLEQTMDKLAFYAKFCSKIYGIMQRIGPHGEGYAKLSEEFATHVGTCKRLMSSIIEQAPPEVRRRFDEAVLAMSPAAFANLVNIFHDISWYKNLQIDRRMKR